MDAKATKALKGHMNKLNLSNLSVIVRSRLLVLIPHPLRCSVVCLTSLMNLPRRRAELGESIGGPVQNVQPERSFVRHHNLCAGGLPVFGQDAGPSALCVGIPERCLALVSCSGTCAGVRSLHASASPRWGCTRLQVCCLCRLPAPCHWHGGECPHCPGFGNPLRRVAPGAGWQG